MVVHKAKSAQKQGNQVSEAKFFSYKYFFVWKSNNWKVEIATNKLDNLMLH